MKAADFPVVFFSGDNSEVDDRDSNVVSGIFFYYGCCPMWLSSGVLRVEKYNCCMLLVRFPLRGYWRLFL